MSIATDTLQIAATEWRQAQVNLLQRRIERDDAKRTLADIESQVFVDSTASGAIDGKNAETRDAQAKIAYKQSPQWQLAWDAFVAAENAYQTALADFEWAKVSLGVQATLVNSEIAQAGGQRLLAEVSLASV